MKDCRVCKKPFQEKTSNIVFCSDDCRGIFYGRKPEAVRERLKQNKQAVSDWRRRTKLKAIEYKGNQCQVCSYNKCPDALEFHHLDPTKKDFGIGHKGVPRSWERITKKLDKCVLLCCRCHREVHAGIITL